MRYFKLVNSDGDELDITTKEIFFHSVEGLGFDEENTFRRIGRMWSLIVNNEKQSKISGKVCFTDNGDTTPYQKYLEFVKFIFKTPLTLKYKPDDSKEDEYSKTVRVSKLDKSEINEYGVLDEKIEYVSYTPWYLIKYQTIEPPEEDEDAGWIWDSRNIWRNSASDTPGYGDNRYKFGAEKITSVSFECEDAGLVRITIDGPAVNPSWTQHVDGILVATGGFDSTTPLTLAEGEKLIIDNTNGSYSMTVRESGGTIRNVYSMRDFDKDCFFTLRKGLNVISAVTSDDSVPHITVEGHILYATV